jgi:hypothetical protein
MVVPAVLMMAIQNWAGGAVLILLAVLVLIVPAAMYSTFYHAVWTIFFRRMTGVEPAPVAAPAPAYPLAPPVPPAPAVASAAPAVPAPEAPPAPPASPAPPAPPEPPAPPAEPPAGADA